MKRALIVFAAIVMATLLLVIGFLSGRHTSPSSMPANMASTSPDGHGKKILYWYDTMVPQEHFDRPGLSPMGMQMVPKYADEGADPNIIRIDPATVQNLGIRTVTVERRVLASAIQVPGTITWDLRQATTVSARADGVVTTLFVRAPYTTITAGEPLAALLAPQWNSALAEYGALQQAQSSDAQALRAAARQRLGVLGLSDADIRTAHRGVDGGIVLHAPQAGVVTTLDVREGQRVSAGQTLMTINGLSTVWIEAALPQAVAGTVRSGTPVSVTADALPGRVFHGTVETLLPDIDAMTRTQRARIVLANPDAALSPGMFATVQLAPASGEAVPVIPDDALITTGSQARVIVSEGNGHFRAMAVRTGRASGGYTEILAGLEGNEKVVISGQFLIDSEASLSGALDRLNGNTVQPAPAASAPMSDMHMGDQP
ncbi:cobalt transporter [Dyella lipolytica]|uniref:Efflux RND transporter periplasmic adaptor subunit n=1 Tax=Dyella lipolytica TaxID=1867835 RepID=A0ABW8IWC9_9GAMM|nr:efflux RND transporter periplasmic adaptor subunit [Dyella lipolytica]GLQ46536.1 cobalt transporter [Dyella lipolytica]